MSSKRPESSAGNAKSPKSPKQARKNPPKARRTAHEAKLSPAQLDQYYRGEACNENNFTHLPFFASALVSLEPDAKGS